MEDICRRIRRATIDMVQRAGSGHLGSSLSVIEILVALYYSTMDPEHDRVILSKGHGCPALYAVLIDRGLIPESEAPRLRKFGGILKGHPDMRSTPGIEFSTGSLGQGFSAAAGLALAYRMDGRRGTIFAILGDGELDEGQCWEAFAFAAHLRLDNLVVVIDRNGLQLDGFTSHILDMEPLADKLRAFRWEVLEADGHDARGLAQSFCRAKSLHENRPVAVIARTVKGKGVYGFENTVESHSRLLTPEEWARSTEAWSR
ncbi:MAG: transketolase [Firmicutes bacterium]|nr:transketolase [Bacillota bacterium]